MSVAHGPLPHRPCRGHGRRRHVVPRARRHRMKWFSGIALLIAFVFAFALPRTATSQDTTAGSATVGAGSAGADSTQKPSMPMEHKSSGKKAKATKSVPKVDINSATKEDLMKLPGIGDAIADKIIAGRPFKTKGELLSKKIVNKGQYSKMRSLIIAKQEAAAK